MDKIRYDRVREDKIVVHHLSEMRKRQLSD
jgi:hypothetical protein